MRNTRLKVALLLTALMMTLVIYGIVQADPASHPAATQTALAGPSNEGSSQPVAPSSGDDEQNNVPVTRPMPQARTSRGS
jgi:hypothetical protein